MQGKQKGEDMKQKFQLVSIKEGGPIFDIVSYDPETKRGRLRGKHGTVFEENMDREFLKKQGYRVAPVKETENA